MNSKISILLSPVWAVGQGNHVSDSGPPQRRECPDHTTRSLVVRIMHTFWATAMQRDVCVNDILRQINDDFLSTMKKIAFVQRTMS